MPVQDLNLQDLNFQNLNWSRIHASAFDQARGFLRWAVATPRRHGALRYRCPVAGSYVLVTDEPTLDVLSRPPARIRCADCGEQHLVAVEADDPADIVAPAGKP
jgi:hypothetical protein